MRSNSENGTQTYESCQQFLERYIAGDCVKSDMPPDLNGSDLLIISLLSFQQFLRTILVPYITRENFRPLFIKQLLDLNVSFYKCLGHSHFSHVSGEILPLNWCSFLFELCMQVIYIDCLSTILFFRPHVLNFGDTSLMEYMASKLNSRNCK
jgi:hypothetical protein